MTKAPAVMGSNLCMNDSFLFFLQLAVKMPALIRPSSNCVSKLRVKMKDNVPVAVDRKQMRNHMTLHFEVSYTRRVW